MYVCALGLGRVAGLPCVLWGASRSEELDRADVKPDNSSSVWSVHTSSKSSRALVSISLTRKDLDKVSQPQEQHYH
eukprot:6421062-Amphidinium_carterae.1